jgi:hypothetical protein
LEPPVVTDIEGLDLILFLQTQTLEGCWSHRGGNRKK